MRKYYFLLLFLPIYFFSACDKSESGGTVIAPGENDPYIIEAVLCTGISNNHPSGITNFFYTGERVNLWIHWANVTRGQRVTAEWWNPNNNKETEYTSTFQSTTSKQISINYLDLSSFATTGEWVVKVYLDNQFMRSYRFNVGK